jgi:MerR family transcriptional regulator, light-induced transcriptional regulator
VTGENAIAGAGLTTTQLAERTGVPAATLRMWEARHGFPVPARLPGGHRRYSESDVELVLTVIRQRQQGLSLSASIARALGESSKPTSIFAGLAQRRPDLQPMTLSKSAMVALSRAIEDEHIARGSDGVVIGSFQTATFYRLSAARWQELARTAKLAVALADFDALAQVPGQPVEVPIGRDHPLAREWALVFQAPGTSSCLAGWEIPEPRGVPRHAERRFEVLWSPEPEVAFAAASVAADLIEPLAPGVARKLAAALQEPAVPTSPELRSAVKQAHRMLAYLSGGATPGQ